MVAVRRSFLPLILAALFLVPAVRAESSKKDPFSGVPVSGTSADGNTFRGTMNVLGFVNDNGLKAIASLNGTLTSAAGAAQQVAGAIVLVPVANASTAVPTGFGGPIGDTNSKNLTAAPAQAQQQAACNILNLVLGPLDLNLLGLVVHLDQVVLDITAVPGAGNLLGNLLCGVANLLNGTGGGLLGGALTNTITTLLNNIVAALGGL